MIKEQWPLDFRWPTRDPFLFCVHHKDHYPLGDGSLAPKTGLAGRNLGQDFVLQDGFRMYHGHRVPGFPKHPHRGFETITIVTRGYVDHADSLGAAGRYGEGDVQWLTAGGGIQHAEMFPLLATDQDNPLELFQIWLNLPRRLKMAKPAFSMYWHEQIPVVCDPENQTQVRVIAGDFNGTAALPPPVDSWAAQAGSQVAVWLVKLKPGAELALPAATAALSRLVYVFAGDGQVAGQIAAQQTGFEVAADQPCPLVAGGDGLHCLVLQGLPIAEPVVQYGPFVMNDRAEIVAAFNDYQNTGFGGWPWPADDPTHGTEFTRFARYPDGSESQPSSDDSYL